MKTYLKIIGIFEIIAYVIGAIVWFVFLVMGRMPPIVWLYYFITLFFAPAFGVCCLGVAKCLERLPPSEEEIKKYEAAKDIVVNDEVVVLISTRDAFGNIVREGEIGKVVGIIGDTYRVEFKFESGNKSLEFKREDLVKKEKQY